MSPLIVSASAQHERGPHTEDFSAALVELCRKSVKPQKRWADPHIVPRLPPLWHPARLLHTPRAVPPVGGPGVSAPALPTNCCSPRGAPSGQNHLIPPKRCLTHLRHHESRSIGGLRVCDLPIRA